MSVQLAIDDGDPWYLSPDIWVVPGHDPSSSPGMPIVSKPSYVWARVHNRGTLAVSNATVRYYWANPSMIITPETATLIGTSYVSLAPGETKEVLCLSEWIPSWVNQGHECLIAEAFSAADPVLHGLTDPFNPPDDRHVAQKNIGVAITTVPTSIYSFAAGNAARFNTEEVIIRTRRAPVKILSRLQGSLGLEKLPEEIGEVKEFGIRSYRCGDHIDDVGDQQISLRIKPKIEESMALVIKMPSNFDRKSGALFLVEELVKGKIVGGIVVLVLAETKKTTSRLEQPRTNQKRS